MIGWGRAGVRLSTDELRRRARTRQREHTESDRSAHAAWRRGQLAPWRITRALDEGDHSGPEVDIACKAEEPAVDEWEAGARYPTWEQLCALAVLTGRRAEWFTVADEPLDIRSTSLWGHMTKRDRERWKPPILTFTDTAVENCPGTIAYEELHLF